jgi:hypothetical protein
MTSELIDAITRLQQAVKKYPHELNDVRGGNLPRTRVVRRDDVEIVLEHLLNVVLDDRK